MAFFDKFKSTADSLKDKAVDLAQSGVAKSKQLAEIAKLNLANNSEEENIKKAYAEIGKLYYEAQGLTPDPVYAEICAKITAAKTTIEENKARIAELKAAADNAEAAVDAAAEDEPYVSPFTPAEEEVKSEDPQE